jgi:hypothetical protein
MTSKKPELEYIVEQERCEIPGCVDEILYAASSFDERSVKFYCKPHAESLFTDPVMQRTVKWFHRDDWRNRRGVGHRRNF